MKAMVLEKLGQPLQLMDWPIPQPRSKEILLRVKACAVCRTDLHVFDGELPQPKLPLVLGHEIVGVVEAVGQEVTRFRSAEMIGVPWLGATCQQCHYCRSGRENLCDQAQFTGYQRDGGYAQYTVAREEFCFPIPPAFSPLQAAPLLCAGLIGYRSLVMAGQSSKIGVYGFGAAAHIVAQVIVHQGRQCYAFTRPGDLPAQKFAREIGAIWAGGSDEMPPTLLDAALLFAPVGKLIPQALSAVAKGGVVVCGGIHMSDIPSFPYSLLWGERVIRSVANLTRKDGEEFLPLAARIPISTEIHPYPLASANQALEDLRNGRFQGAAVLVID